ncbi:MAG: hypothetical protein ACOYLH_07925 [Flavobacteriales bacterium]
MNFTMAILALSLSAFILVIVLVYRMFNTWMHHKERAWVFELKADNNKAMSAVRIPAFERIVIMLERISPSSLVMRQNVSHMTASMLQLELMRSVREEYEHNVSLQIYVSDETWDLVQAAKDEVLEIIKESATRVSPQATSIDLSREIFKLEASTENIKIKRAITAVKSEL